MIDGRSTEPSSMHHPSTSRRRREPRREKDGLHAIPFSVYTAWMDGLAEGCFPPRFFSDAVFIHNEVICDYLFRILIA